MPTRFTLRFAPLQPAPMPPMPPIGQPVAQVAPQQPAQDTFAATDAAQARQSFPHLMLVDLPRGMASDDLYSLAYGHELRLNERAQLRRDIVQERRHLTSLTALRCGEPGWPRSGPDVEIAGLIAAAHYGSERYPGFNSALAQSEERLLQGLKDLRAKQRQTLQQQARWLPEQSMKTLVDRLGAWLCTPLSPDTRLPTDAFLDQSLFKVARYRSLSACYLPPILTRDLACGIGLEELADLHEPTLVVTGTALHVFEFALLARANLDRVMACNPVTTLPIRDDAIYRVITRAQMTKLAEQNKRFAILEPRLARESNDSAADALLPPVTVRRLHAAQLPDLLTRLKASAETRLAPRP